MFIVDRNSVSGSINFSSFCLAQTVRFSVSVLKLNLWNPMWTSFLVHHRYLGPCKSYMTEFLLGNSEPLKTGSKWTFGRVLNTPLVVVIKSPLTGVMNNVLFKDIVMLYLIIKVPTFQWSDWSNGGKFNFYFSLY